MPMKDVRRRGYSRQFTPFRQTGKRYLLDDIPAGLWSAVRTKCQRERISMRAAILRLLTGWVSEERTNPS